MRHLVALLLCLLLCQGCFVFDEIDKGNEVLDKHFGAARRKKEQELAAHQAESAPRPEKAEAGLLEQAQEWWRKMREPKPVERDPDDIVVRCEVDGDLHFTRKSDCAVRGGRVI